MQSYIEKLVKISAGHPWDFRCAHVAGIFDGKILVSHGFNRKKTHPLQLRFKRQGRDSIWIHAEIEAIHRAIRLVGLNRLERCTLVVIRIDQKGAVMSSPPCTGCQRAIVEFNLRKVLWS